VRKDSRDHRLWILPAFAVAIFALFIVHRKWLLGSNREIHGSLMEKFSKRLFFGDQHPVDVIWGHLRDVVHLYTLPLVFLASIWICFLAWNLFKRQLKEPDWLLLVLLGYGLLHNAVFAELTWHDYIARCYTPAIALAAALASLRILALANRALPAAIIAPVAYLSFAFIALCVILEVRARVARDHAAWFYELRRTGLSINAWVGDRDLVLMPKADDVLNYYVDRQVRAPVTTLEEVMKVSRESKAHCFYACPAPQVDSSRDLITQLDAKFPRIRQDDPIIYALSAPNQ
jgi:hypothetical protein